MRQKSHSLHALHRHLQVSNDMCESCLNTGATDSSDESAKSRPVVLLADDDPVALRVTGKMLKQYGFRTIGVSDGEAAIDALRQPLCDDPQNNAIILLDVHMPRVSGLDVLRWIEDNPDNCNAGTPVMMLSGTEEMSVVVRCLQGGAVDFHLKPLSRSTCANLLSNVHRAMVQRDALTSRRSDLSASQSSDDVSSAVTQLQPPPPTTLTATTSQAIVDIVNSMLTSTEAPPVFKAQLHQILKHLNAVPVSQTSVLKRLSLQTDEQTRQCLREILGSDLPTAALPPAARLLKENPDVAHSDVIKLLKDPYITMWRYSLEQLETFAVAMYTYFALPTELSIPLPVLRAFIHAIRAKYPDNVYHNFRHAIDVMHSMFVLLTVAKASQLLSQLDVFALLTACLCHDVGHMGVSNSFVVATEHELALFYNDQSVMEHYHAYTCFQVMRAPECNIMASFPKADRLYVRRSIISCILATDTMKHKTYMQRFDDVVPAFDSSNPVHVQALCDMLIKVCDVGNTYKPFQEARVWTRLVQEEFWMQGDQEKQCGMPVAGIFDREQPRMTGMAVTFLEGFAIPMYASLVRLVPGFQLFLDQASSNLRDWKAMDKAAAVDQAAATAAALSAAKVASPAAAAAATTAATATPVDAATPLTQDVQPLAPRVAVSASDAIASPTTQQ